MTTMTAQTEAMKLINAGALVVVNHSGGKDSQAMLIHLRAIVPAAQLVIVHADLGEVEWPDTQEQVRRYAGQIPVMVTSASYSLLDYAEQRKKWPSPSQRWCTSNLKRDPIAKVIRNLANKGGHKVIISAMGLRGQESTDRAQAPVWKLNKRLTCESKGRLVYDWLPIHEMTTEEVFASIAAAGEQPHWAYKAGMTRLSCSFCIMASQGDLTTAAKLRTALYARYVALEKSIGQTMIMPRKGQAPRGLEEITGVPVVGGAA